MKDIKWLWIVFLFCSGSIFGQADSALLKNNSPRTLKKMGVNAMRQNDASSAISFFEAYLLTNQRDAVVMSELATAYLRIRDYDRAQVLFLRAYELDRKKAPEALYYHALMQKSNGKYDSAKFNFQKFKKEYKGSEKILKRLAAKEISFCDSLEKLVKYDRQIFIQHLDTGINKVNAEGAPVNIDDNTILFSSLRTDTREYIVEDDTAETKRKKIYLARRSEGKWKFAGEFDVLNDDRFNSGNVCFSPDRKRIYFTRCRNNINEEMICAIWMSEKQGDRWTEPVKLPSPLNSRKYTSTMPTVASDPKKGHDVIYFVSNRPKGKGGLDIWFTSYDKKKKIFKQPRNAGNKVNTIKDEITPFFDNESRTLFFSSEGHGGLGGFDIYKALGDGLKFTGVENMGKPLNSGADDIYYTISTTRNEGFMVSNRKGGNALKHSTCCDDIYTYKNKKYFQVELAGTVGEAIDPFEPSANADIDVYIRDKTSGDRFYVKSARSDDKGNFNLKLEPDKNYVLVVKKKDHLGTIEEVDTHNAVPDKTINRNIVIAKKPKEAIVLPLVEYDFGKATLTPMATRVIDSLLLPILIANPEIIIELSAHTDSKGNDLFNLKLSQKRAESVVRYLASKGITMKRMEPRGYGERKPIAPNDMPDGRDNPEGRAKNRRTEFLITGTLDTEDIESSDD